MAGEIGVAGRNLRKHRVNMQTPNTKAPAGIETQDLLAVREHYYPLRATKLKQLSYQCFLIHFIYCRIEQFHHFISGKTHSTKTTMI